MTTKSAKATSQLYTSTWVDYFNRTGQLYSSGSASNWSPPQGAFSLSYEDGPQHNADGSPHWKACTHDKGIYFHYTPMSFTYRSSMLTGWGTIVGRGLLPAGSSWMNDLLGYQPMPSVATCYQDHLNEIYGQVKPSMLGIENLASLFGGKSLFKSTEAGIRALMAAVKHSSRSTLKDVVKTLSGMDLAIMFSVESTVSDIESSINLFEGWKAHIAKLRARQSSDVLLYKTSKTNMTTEQQQCEWATSWVGLPGPALPLSLVFNEQRQASSTVTCFTRAKVRYTQDTLSVINYLQGALGLNRPLSSIWAIVPMSFLLDYVVSIQTLCDELDSTLNRSTAVQQMLQVQETWVTLKKQSMFKASLPPGPCGGGGYTGSHDGWSVEQRQSNFSRQPLALDSVYSGWSSVGSITPRKAATVAEIAFQIFA